MNHPVQLPNAILNCYGLKNCNIFRVNLIIHCRLSRHHCYHHHHYHQRLSLPLYHLLDGDTCRILVFVWGFAIRFPVRLTSLLTPHSKVFLEKLTGFAANQEIPRILWNPKVHYRTHKCPHLSPSCASSIQSIHPHPTSCPSMPESPKWSPSFRFPHQNPVYASPLPHTRYMSRLSHSSRFYHPDYIGCAVQIIKLLIM